MGCGARPLPPGSLTARSPHENLPRAPIGSRIVFLCQHFSGVNELLNFGGVSWCSWWEWARVTWRIIPGLVLQVVKFTMVIDFVPKSWGCGTSSKWPFNGKWGLLTTGSNWDDPPSIGQSGWLHQTLPLRSWPLWATMTGWIIWIPTIWTQMKHLKSKSHSLNSKGLFGVDYTQDLRYMLFSVRNHPSATLRRLEYHAAPKGFIDIAGVWTQPASQLFFFRRPREKEAHEATRQHSRSETFQVKCVFSMKYWL